MSPAFDPGELGEHADPDDDVALTRLALRLESERPLPSPTFRGNLRRRLLGTPAVPRRLRLQIALYGTSGFLLLLVGASSAAGLGPLAA